MPNIPTYTSQLSASAPGAQPRGRLPEPRVSASAFDTSATGMGQAVQNVGSALGQVGEQMFRLDQEAVERDRTATVAATAAKFDPTTIKQDVLANSKPDGSDVLDNLSTGYKKAQDDLLAGVDDNITRQRLRTHFDQMWPSLQADAVKSFNDQREGFARQQADDTLNTSLNQVRANPAVFPMALENTRLALDARSSDRFGRVLSEGQRTEMGKKAYGMLADAMFDGQITNAKTLQDIAPVEQALKDGKAPDGTDWKSVFDPKRYDAALTALASRKQQIVARSEADAKAVLGSVRTRVDDLTPVSPDEFTKLAPVVAQGNSPSDKYAFARTERDNTILLRDGKSALPDLRAKVDGLRAIVAAAGGAAAFTQGSQPIAAAINGQESGGDPNAPTSVDGATGGWQITPDTFKRYAKPGEDINNPAHNEAVGRRIVDDLHNKTGGDAARVAVGYFSGEGNIAPPGSETPWKEDRKDGNGKSVSSYVSDVLKRMGVSGAQAATSPGGPSGVNQRVAFDDLQMYEKMLTAAQKAEKDGSLLQYAQQRGSHTIRPLDGSPESWAARGNDVRAVAGYNGVPVASVTPFLPSELDAYSRKMESARPEDALDMMSGIQKAGSDVAEAAYKKLGEKAPVFAYAAGLDSFGNSHAVALDVVRGQQALSDAKGGRKAFPVEEKDVALAFHQYAADATQGMAAKDREALMDAAFAHYYQTQVLVGGKMSWDADKFKSSIDATAGGALGKVNGRVTVPPPGATTGDMQAALSRMKGEDIRRLAVADSGSGYVALPGAYPHDARGVPFTEDEFRREAKLIAVGGGFYKVSMYDKEASIGMDARGRSVPYILSLPAPVIRDLANRPDPMRAPVPSNGYDPRYNPTGARRGDPVDAAVARGVAAVGAWARGLAAPDATLDGVRVWPRGGE